MQRLFMSKFSKCLNSSEFPCILYLLESVSTFKSSSSNVILLSESSTETFLNPISSSMGCAASSGMKTRMQTGQLMSVSRGTRVVVQATLNLPPGFSTRCISRNAAALSEARQKAPLEMTTSNCPSQTDLVTTTLDTGPI